MGGNPRAIEDQEAAGQKELIISEQLPRKCNSPRNTNIVEQYRLMGIEVLSESNGDELFLDVKMPLGWKKEATTHSMWNILVDDKGRERGRFFYKAAFYDRDAFINFSKRYQQECKYYENKDYSHIVLDTETKNILFESGKLNSYNIGEDYFKNQDLYIKQCKDFLDNNFPNHNDINAYWS